MLTTISTAYTIVRQSAITVSLISGARRQYSSRRLRHLTMGDQLHEEDKSKKKGSPPKQRGHPRDSPEVRLSKSLSWLLRHGAEKANLHIRQDGYAKVSDVVSWRYQRLLRILQS
jgi:RNA:NAD 2'-phosphotransferase (TPT1/KptA family)